MSDNNIDNQQKSYVFFGYFTLFITILLQILFLILNYNYLITFNSQAKIAVFGFLIIFFTIVTQLLLIKILKYKKSIFFIPTLLGVLQVVLMQAIFILK